MSLRVIMWAPGHVGTHALLGILDHPDLELVGVRVYSPSKDGKDAGELCGRPPTGVLATRDVGALLALDADCVVYCATESGGFDPIIEDYCTILSAGINIASSTLLPLVFPPTLPASLAGVADRLEAACQQGGSTFYVSGVNPGCLIDIIPPLIASGSRDIRSIRIVERFDDIFENGFPAEVLQGQFGFGTTLEEDVKFAELRMAVFEEYWSSPLYLLANGLGGTLENLTIERHLLLADKAYDVPNAPIEPGTIAGLHARLEGDVDGTHLTYDEYLAVSPDIPRPDWPEGMPGCGGYRIEIEGSPNVQVQISFLPDETADGPDVGRVSLEHAMAFTGIRLVSAVPFVCAAPAGVHHFEEIGRQVAGRARSKIG